VKLYSPRSVYKNTLLTVMTVSFILIVHSYTAIAAESKLPSISFGLAEVFNQSVFECGNGPFRPSPLGNATSTDGRSWIVPADVSFMDSPKASDIYNECSEVMISATEQIHLNSIPVAQVDPDGEIITAYIHADNYFELYINGIMVAVDAIPFTPFNSSIVRFRVKRPFSIAAMLVDWEESSGVGTESGFQNNGQHAGDGGMVGTFKDESNATIAITNANWKAQTFYTAPLYDPACLTMLGNQRLSNNCRIEDGGNPEELYSAHWQIPEQWMSPDFDDQAWPNAHLFSNETVVVANKAAFMNFLDVFDDPVNDAEFIWSSNLVLDNLVLVRYLVE
jgi:hypothetical protein